MEPRSRLCRFDNVSQDGDSARAAEAANNHHHHSTPNVGSRHPLVFAVSNPATEAEDDPGWSISETYDSH